jgi:phosphopantetheine--protein transferase-like protein
VIPRRALKFCAPQLSGGVDIVEWKKAKAFYETHHEKLGSFLSPEERRFVEKKHKPYEGLAMIFAAKGAVFKTLGLSWMGPEGFRRIQVRPVSSKKFYFLPTKGQKLVVLFKKSRHHVVACCFPF